MKKILVTIFILAFSTQIFALSTFEDDIKKRSSVQNLTKFFIQNEFDQGIKLYYQGKVAQAYQSFQKACTNGYAFSCTYLAALYSNNHHATQQQIQSLFQRGCELGDGTGCNHLGFLYENGKTKDYNLAVRLYRLSCDLGESLGCYNLARLYKEGAKEDISFLSKAAELFEKGCNDDNAASCTDLGYLFEEQGYLDEAIFFYDKGCRLGNPEGCGFAGMFYQKQGNTRANDYWIAGCKMGNEISCNILQNLKTNTQPTNQPIDKSPKVQTDQNSKDKPKNKK